MDKIGKKKPLGQKWSEGIKRDFGIEKNGEDKDRKREKIRYDTYSYYCPYCKGMREGVKKFSWGWFIFWTLITGGLGLIFYPIYYASKSKTQCHTCYAKIAKSNKTGLFEKPNN